MHILARMLYVACAATPLLAQIPKFELLGSFSTGVFNQGAAEIVAYDREGRRLYVVNGGSRSIDVLDISSPAFPGRSMRLFAPEGRGKAANSVAVRGDVVAAAFEADVKTDPGFVVFYATDGRILSSVRVGALPDMITFTPDGNSVLTANEGEPNESYAIDPEGSVSIIDIRRGAAAVTQDDVTTLDFKKYNNEKLDPSIRVYGPKATVAQDFEPEYIAVSPDSRRAYVTLQENNAIAVLDLERKEFVRLMGLGFKDHSKEGNGLDASDRDNKIDIRTWPVFGMYQPDAIAAFEHGGATYLVMANEGDSRDYPAFAEEARVGALNLDPAVFPTAADLKRNENLGRLTVSRVNADTDGDGDIDRLYVLGGRSFTIRREDGTIVFDSGDAIEKLIAERFPKDFNSDATGGFDTRSDNKGPEPEGLAVATIGGKRYLFVGLERMSGILVYDISDPLKPVFVDYVHNRKFEGDASKGTGGDHGPEGFAVIAAADSPTGEALLVVANEVSGSTTIYKITQPAGAATIEAKISPATLSTVTREITLDASESTGAITTYEWRVTGKSAGIVRRDPGGKQVSIQFAQGFGEYIVELTVKDAAGATSTATSKLFYAGR